MTLQTYTVTFDATDDGVPTTMTFHKIICDYCGEVILDDGVGIYGDYYEYNGGHYHPQCYEVIK